jgi:hypothetical protein
MTQVRDFDSIARAWLEAGPNEAPDRAVAAVLAAIETTPQMRRPWRWPLWRPITTPRRTLSLIVAVILALLIGTSLFVGGPRPPSPSPTPSVSPAVPPSMYESLVAEWAGPTRTATGGSAPSGIMRGRFTQDGAWNVSGSTLTVGQMSSSAAVIAADRLTLATTTGGNTCQIGDVGTYRYQLSPGKKRLTLTVDADPCADRITATQGTWVRSECDTGPGIAGGDWDCYGPLEAGTYKSREVNLRFDISGGEVAPIVYGALTLTVPDGWTHVADNATRFWMMPTSQYGRIHDGVALDGLYVYGHPQAASHVAGCPYEPQAGVGLTPSQIVTFIASVPAFHATAPKPITINGRSGLWTDIKLASSWTKLCDWSEGRPASSILYANTGLSGVDTRNSERLIVLDIGHGDAAAIEIFAADSNRFDAFVAEAMPIVESFVFAEPDATN